MEWADRNGVGTLVGIPPAPYNELALSPDGRRVALVGGSGGVSDLWVADLARGGLTRLTFGEYVSSPVWTPDGSRLAYGTRLQGRKDNAWQIVWKPADGSRQAEVLVEGKRFHLPNSFSPDGRTLIYHALNSDATASDIWILPLDAPRTPHPLVSGAFLKREGAVSPDGRWLAYVSEESGQSQVFVRPFPEGDGRWQISSPNGLEPTWSHDGRELFYRSDSVLYRVPVETSRTFSAGRPERLLDRVASGDVRTYSPAPDGSRILTFRSPESGRSERTMYLDLGFAERVRTLAAAKP
jgi:Tol biopolymer transport system component